MVEGPSGPHRVRQRVRQHDHRQFARAEVSHHRAWVNARGNGAVADHNRSITGLLPLACDGAILGLTRAESCPRLKRVP